MSNNVCKQICEDSPAVALYVHVPFCLAKCRYCDFYSLPLTPELAGRFVQAALTEMNLRREELAASAETIFLGGGTPTALGTSPLDQLLGALAPLAADGCEFSVESNPGTLTDELAGLMRRQGVNRVNLGAQSFHDDELRLLGRIHTALQARQAVEMLRRKGFDNLGLDLIYGIPGQTLDTWRQSLRQALDLGLAHLSCYALSFEPGTPLCHDLAAGKVAAMDESLQKECYHLAIESAAAAGLEHYEISNFAAPGRRCRHNLVYWKNESYLGLGPAAVSYVGGVRRKNPPSLEAYLQALEAGRLPETLDERIAGKMKLAETLMLGLRMIDGVDRAEFSRRFGVDPLTAFPSSLPRYWQLGALVVTDSAIRIAREYLFVADTILADIVAEAADQ